MKKWILTALLFCMAALLSSCNVLEPDVESLMTPPKLTGDQTEVFEALSAAIGTDNIRLKYPMTGEYRSAFVFHDLDGDGQNEALVFYQMSADDDTSRVSILDKGEQGWVCLSDVPGSGSEIQSIQFAPIMQKDRDNIVIAWTQENQEGITAAIYGYDQETGKLKTLNSPSGDYYTIVDSDQNGYYEMLLLSLGGGQDPSVQLVRRRSSKLVLATSEAKLSARVKEFKNVTFGNISNGKSAIFIDEMVDTDTFVTEVVLIDENKLTNLMMPKGSEEEEDREALLLSTARYDELYSEDIDGDGFVEIPVQSLLPGYSASQEEEEKVYLTTYCTMSRTALSPKTEVLINKEMGYQLTLPRIWRDNVTVKKIHENGEWRVVVYEGSLENSLVELLRIRVNSHKDYQDKFEIGTYVTLAQKGIFDYLGYIPTENHPLSITPLEMREMFSLL